MGRSDGAFSIAVGWGGGRRMRKQKQWDGAFSIEIIEEILSRLPVDSLCRFRCVCKSWNDLIRDPHFVKMQLSRSIQNDPELFLVTNSKVFSMALQGSRGKKIPTELDCPFVSSTDIEEVAGSCDGLICFSLFSDKTLHVWNPSTGYYKALPDAPYVWRLGFGYSPANDEYKVIGYTINDESDDESNDESDDESEAIVHTLGTNSWRSVECYPRINEVISPGVSLNGAIHWLAYANPPYYSTRIKFIVCFDLETEKFGEILLPDLGDEVSHLKLAVLGGLLTISYRSRKFFETWVMQEYGDERSWTRQITEPLKKFKWYSAGLEPLGVLQSGEIIISNFWNRIAFYNPRTRKVRSVGIHRYPTSGFWACTYVESLVTVGVLDDEKGND